MDKNEFDKLIEDSGGISQRMVLMALKSLVPDNSYGLTEYTDEIVKNLDDECLPPIEVGPRIRVITIKLTENLPRFG